MPWRPTGETPFKFTFKTKVVIPMEISLPTIKIKNFHEKSNSNQLRTDVDTLDETRERAQIRM